MNLVQIQERLKDLPMQAIMSYANGQNPQVPPYLALGEMNRRKKMEEQAVQPPKGTVKDNLEQQVGVMQLQKMRQGMMGQPQAPQAPEAMPEQAPQPEAEMAMAAGGVANLPVHMDFKSGGIIAFANPEGNQLVSEAEAAAKAAKQKLSIYSLSQRLKDPEGYAAAQAEADIAQQNLDKAYRGNGPAGVMGRDMGQPIPPKPKVVVPPAPEVPAAAPVVEAPAPKPVPPAPRVVQNSGIATTLQKQNEMANPAAPVVSVAQKAQEDLLKGIGLPKIPEEYKPPVQAPIGEDYLKFMTEREQKRQDDVNKFNAVQQARDKRDFFNSLIEGAEASRGQRGIGALVGSTGKSAGRYATEAEDRRMAFDKAQQELADNDAKTRFEINNLRRAEERSDSKAIYDSRVKLVDLGNQRAQLQGTIANSMSSNESQERIAKANNLTHLEVARINQATAMKPGETERLMTQYAAIKAKDPVAAEQFLVNLERIKTGSRGETNAQKVAVARQSLAEKLPAYQMAITSYTNAKDPTKKKEALDKIREIESLHGIKSEDATSIDTTQWGNLKVK